MRLFMITANTLAAVVSLAWLWGHSSAPRNGWEFWFSLLFGIVALANLAYIFRWGQQRFDED